MIPRLVMVSACIATVIATTGVAAEHTGVQPEPKNPYFTLTPMELISTPPLLFDGRVAAVEDNVAVIDVLRTYRGEVGERTRVPEIRRVSGSNAAVRFSVGERWLIGLNDEGELYNYEDSRLSIDDDANIAETITALIAITDPEPNNDAKAQRSLVSRTETFGRLADVEQVLLLDALGRDLLPIDQQRQFALLDTALMQPLQGERLLNVRVRAINALLRRGLARHYARTLADGLESDNYMTRVASINAIRQATSSNFGYDHRKPLEDQQDAIRACREWAASVTDVPPIKPPR